jgi:flagellar motor switch protein FliN/FliY
MIDIPIEVRVVLGTKTLRIKDLLKMGRGAVLELDRKVEEPVDLYAGKTLIAKGVIKSEGNRIFLEITEKL